MRLTIGLCYKEQMEEGLGNLDQNSEQYKNPAASAIIHLHTSLCASARCIPPIKTTWNPLQVLSNVCPNIRKVMELDEKNAFPWLFTTDILWDTQI